VLECIWGVFASNLDVEMVKTILQSIGSNYSYMFNISRYSFASPSGRTHFRKTIPTQIMANTQISLNFSECCACTTFSICLRLHCLLWTQIRLSASAPYCTFAHLFFLSTSLYAAIHDEYVASDSHRFITSISYV